MPGRICLHQLWSLMVIPRLRSGVGRLKSILPGTLPLAVAVEMVAVVLELVVVTALEMDLMATCPMSQG